MYLKYLIFEAGNDDDHVSTATQDNDYDVEDQQDVVGVNAGFL